MKSSLLSKIGLIFLLLTMSVTLWKCSGEEISAERKPKVKIDMPKILARDTLKVIISYGPTNYFLYRGQPMGFHYELMKRFAEYLDVELKVVIAENLDQFIKMLNRGEGDIIAHNLTITKNRKRKVAFSEEHTPTQQVLVQKMPKKWRKMPMYRIKEQLILSVHELEGDTVHVRKNSAYFERLKFLSHEIGGDIHIDTVAGDVTTEELIEWVSKGKIGLTAADEDIAKINKTYLQNLFIDTQVSLLQRNAWALRKNSPKLMDTLNHWIKKIKRKPTYNIVYNKYFNDRKGFVQRLGSDLFALETGNISRYDEIIKEYADKIDWDWKLLASLVYAESQFNRKAQSWAGAKGLMQLMDPTAEQYNVSNPLDPRQNVSGGTRYLKDLGEFWKDIPDSLERRKFILASYNVGQYHVRDAQRLAEKYDKDPKKWDGSVGKYLKLKSKPDYYNDDVVKYGYCRGEEPVSYVKAIFYIYRHYSKLTEEQEEKAG